MSWYKSRLGSSLLAILSVGWGSDSREDRGDRGDGQSAGEDDYVTLEEIRRAMLQLVRIDQSDRGLKVGRRIRYAADVQALWFLRGEVMGLLARTRGEVAAWEEINRISDLFGDLLPHGLRSRPSPLSANHRGRSGSGEP